MGTVILFGLLFIKHLLLDFVYQPPYQFMNKGIYGHWGGIVHSLQHVIGTGLVFLLISQFIFINWWLVLIALIFEFLIHYHMDWFKMWWCKKNNYLPHPTMGCTNDQATKFWIWLGIDQFIHNLSYVVIVASVLHIQTLGGYINHFGLFY